MRLWAFRNLRLDRVPSGFDIRHAFKINSIYELPLGPGRKYLSNTNAFVRKVLGGWEIAGVGRVQTGTPFQLTSGRSGMNTSETGVVLYNITASELQDMMQIRKTTGSNGIGQVFYLPQPIIDNTNAAFEQQQDARSEQAVHRTADHSGGVRPARVPVRPAPDAYRPESGEAHEVR